MRAGSFLALALGAVACATVGELVPPPGPPPFEGVRCIALVRSVGDPAARRAKDALDALGESLAERGYRTRLVEVGSGIRGRDDLERLFGRVHARIAAGGNDRYPRESRGIEGEARTTLAALGVDAAAMVHRFDALPPMPPLESPFAPAPETFFGPPGGEWQHYRPVGALSLVNRAGDVVWFDWGTPPPERPGAPANAAEAVDAVLRVLSGQELDEPDLDEHR